MMLLPQKRFSEFVLVLDNFFLYPFLLLHLALPCSSLLRRKRRSAHPFNTLTSKIDSRISVVSYMNNYVGTINNNCVGGMAGYITGFVDNFVPGDEAAFISAEKWPWAVYVSLQVNLLPATGNSIVAGAGDGNCLQK